MYRFLVLALAGCATSGRPLAQRDQEAQVCVDRGTLRQGQQISFRRRVCGYLPPHRHVFTCDDEQIESGRVVHLIDDHCAIVRPPADAQVRPGDELVLAAQ